jgi:hypothetical protein
MTATASCPARAFDGSWPRDSMVIAMRVQSTAAAIIRTLASSFPQLMMVPEV